MPTVYVVLGKQILQSFRNRFPVMHLTFFAFPFSLFSSLLHSRHYEMDTFVLLEHTRNYKGCNYQTTSLLDVIFVPIPDIVIVLTHGNVTIHQPLDEP